MLIYTYIYTYIYTFNKPNNKPLYINASSNHPPSVLKQIDSQICIKKDYR